MRLSVCCLVFLLLLLRSRESEKIVQAKKMSGREEAEATLAPPDAFHMPLFHRQATGKYFVLQGTEAASSSPLNGTLVQLLLCRTHSRAHPLLLSSPRSIHPEK